MTNQNPFADGPASNEKFMFGTLSLRVNKIVLQAGHEGYAEPDLTNKDGDPYHFKAKVKDSNGYYNHAILVLKCRRRDGGEYLAHRDFLYKDGNPEMEMAMPALRQFFGQNLEKIWGRTAEVKVQDARFEADGYKKSTFVVIEVFTDRAAREAAEQAHFAQFSSPESEPQTGEEIAESMPWDEPVVESAPVSMPLDQAVTLLQPLWLSSGKNADKFYETLAGMPVLVPHFGRTPEEFIQIPEIAKLVGGQALQPEEGI